MEKFDYTLPIYVQTKTSELLKMGHFRASFSLFSSFLNTDDSKQMFNI